MAVVATNQLRDLIQRGLDTRGWTLAELQRQTRRVDPEKRGVAYSSLAAWMTSQGASGLPRVKNLDLVARALGLEVSTVRAAAGYRVEEEAPTDDPDLQIFSANYLKMSPEARARLMKIVRGIMDDEDLFPPKRPNGNGGRRDG